MATRSRSRWSSFCGLISLLNTSINKKPVFFLEVVVYETGFLKALDQVHIEEVNSV